MGDEITLDEEVRLNVRLPVTGGSFLLKDGAVIQEAANCQFVGIRCEGAGQLPGGSLSAATGQAGRRPAVDHFKPDLRQVVRVNSWIALSSTPKSIHEITRNTKVLFTQSRRTNRQECLFSPRHDNAPQG